MNDAGAKAPTKNSKDKAINPGIIDDFFSIDGFDEWIAFVSTCGVEAADTSTFGGG
jgi:hypothetical protein